jgi:hypothetical protein
MPSLMEGCRWLEAPGEGDRPFAGARDRETMLGFPTKRIFWLTRIAHGQTRGSHAHRESILATFAVMGGCRMTLDNGSAKQIVDLRHDGPSLLVGPWIWHDLFDFSPSTVILVAASTLYDEGEYIRDYATFLREVEARKQRH